MKASGLVVVTIVIAALVLVPALCIAGGYGSRPCVPDRPLPPETVGSISVPFDVPIWPTLVKTEFHILPWISFGKASVCIPGTNKAIEFSAPCLSLKPVPVWFPWLRPLDVDCSAAGACPTP
ncbi:MAG: hypothetical protein RDU20_03770 [Desulfomonilaceae bacterium]|nr:hypothetical protein [Desulfomonilaceae bacterium]